MARLELDDSFKDILFKLSEGNPGALTVCMEMYTKGAAIDPDAFSPIAPLLGLDTLEIYGSRIWMLYKDVCGQNLTKTIGLLRGWQLGFVSQAELKHAIENYGDGLDLDKILIQVQDALTNFNLEA